MSNEIVENFDLTSELHLIRHESFGSVFTLKSCKKTYGIFICHTKSIREDCSKNLEIKLVIMNYNIDYREAIDTIIGFCTKYVQNIKYESISIDCNTYNKEICNYLMQKHKFKIEKTQIMMLMGKDNIFKNKDTVLFTRLAG